MNLKGKNVKQLSDSIYLPSLLRQAASALLSATRDLRASQSTLRRAASRFLIIIGLALSLIACSSSSDSNPDASTGGTSPTDGGSSDISSADSGVTDNGATDTSDSGATDNGNTNGDAQSTDGSDTSNSGEQTDQTGADAGAVSTDPIADLPPIVLLPLPQPALTSAPNQADEPVQLSGPVSTVTEYFLVRDPNGVLPEDTFGQITDAEFDAGLLPPLITKPAALDTSVNPAPFFDGLENQTVFAGDTLEILLRPIDSDGTRPGMFPEFIPQSAEYIDNFDRTKTLRWQPLQPDAGISEMKFTAVDELDPQYRAEYTVRVRVLLPEDQSGIPNLAPVVTEMRRHTAQVNDPVVVEIIASDPNGTVPSIEVLNPPAGSTLTPHHTWPNISVLRFVPSTAEFISLNVLARDAIDPSLTGESTIEIDVRPASDFIREGSSLRSLATARNFRFGYASFLDSYHRPDGGIYARIAAEEFNFVTPENALKWGYINPLPGHYRWAAADNLVNFARIKGLEVHGHTLVWYSQLPNWIKFSALEEREIHMREFIDRLLTRYADRIPIWDVVNEVFEDDGSYRNSVWYEAMGPAYVEIAFRQARESAPNARLLYNDYDIAIDGPKSTAMFNMLQALKDRNTPLTGVGFQMHVFADFDKFDEVEANFQKAANMDLDVYVTELDVSMNPGNTEQQQAEVYRRVLDICLRQPRCKGLQSWGFTDMYSWRRDKTPLIFNDGYQAKPAYTALQERLSEN